MVWISLVTLGFLVGVTWVYYRAVNRSAFAALAQAWATIMLVGLTAAYVVLMNVNIEEISRTGRTPFVGVVDAKTHKSLEGPDTYDNVKGAQVDFVIQNTGSTPAKNLTVEVRGRMGNTVLPYNEYPNKMGTILFPGASGTSTVKIGKGQLDQLIAGRDRLIYTVKLSYTDWEGNKKYSLEQKFEVAVSAKEPLTLRVFAPISE
jgi:archaellum component FlaF (FlaF/FlaG flagellin family)